MKINKRSHLLEPVEQVLDPVCLASWWADERHMGRCLWWQKVGGGCEPRTQSSGCDQKLERSRRTLSRVSEEACPCQPLDSGFQPPRGQVNVFLQFSAAQSVVLCYGSLGKMKQPSAIRGFTEMGGWAWKDSGWICQHWDCCQESRWGIKESVRVWREMVALDTEPSSYVYELKGETGD